ncbi:MAG: hypothetical protein M1815_000312 [Lichina confinis]|nr:MAG: hypothetical protein M1815_000312 [Lichina confinis]
MEGLSTPSQVYSATYSNVPVYEIILGKTHVMRRRSDHWVNATHILIVANFDKAARTKVLEREVQRGLHEKVQGGYGKFQGTWIPLEDGRDLAQRYAVMNILGPIFNFVPGDQSPPPAPRQTTTRPRVRRSSANKVDANSSQPDPNRAAPAPLPQTAFAFSSSQGAMSPNPATNAPRWMHARAPSMQSRNFDVEDIPIDPELTDSAISSERGDEVEAANARKTSGRKRRRRQPQQQQQQEQQEQQQHPHQQLEVTQSSPVTPAQPGHVFYGDEILDHLTLLQGAGPDAEFNSHPEPPINFHPDTPLDKDCHTALHWGAALADINLVSDFIARGASIGALSTLGETPLTFASQYTNSFERRTMPRLIGLLGSTVDQADVLGCTALHHAATLTSQPNLALAGRYYFDTVLDYLGHNFSGQDMLRVLDARNVDGDTALIIVARQGDQASVRTLISYGASARIVNDAGKSANDYLRERRERAQWKREVESGSSPPGFRGLASAPPGGLDGAADADDDETLHDVLGSRRNGWRLPNGTTRPGGDGLVSVLDRFSRRMDEPLNRELERIETDDVEITAALARVEAERAQIRARSRGPTQGPDGDVDGSAAEAAEAAEAAALLAAENELRELLTLLESRELLRTMSLSTSTLHDEPQQQQQQQQQQNQQDPSDAPITLFSNDSNNKTQDPSTAEVLSAAIDEQEQRRQRLIAEVVQKTAAAGSRERASRYKTLIAQCLNVGEQELQSLAPAILEHLEAERERKFLSSATTAMADPTASFGASTRAASAAALVAGVGQ